MERHRVFSFLRTHSLQHLWRRVLLRRGVSAYTQKLGLCLYGILSATAFSSLNTRSLMFYRLAWCCLRGKKTFLLVRAATNRRIHAVRSEPSEVEGIEWYSIADPTSDARALQAHHWFSMSRTGEFMLKVSAGGDCCWVWYKSDGREKGRTVRAMLPVHCFGMVWYGMVKGWANAMPY